MIDIVKRILLAYIYDESCSLDNSDCNELTKYISGLNLRISELETQLRDVSKKAHGYIQEIVDAQEKAEKLTDAIDNYLNDCSSTAVSTLEQAMKVYGMKK